MTSEEGEKLDGKIKKDSLLQRVGAVDAFKFSLQEKKGGGWSVYNQTFKRDRAQSTEKHVKTHIIASLLSLFN